MKKILILLFCAVMLSGCGERKFSETDYEFESFGPIYDYTSVPDSFWNAEYERHSEYTEFGVLEEDRISNLEYVAYEIYGRNFADDSKKEILDKYDISKYQAPFDFNIFRDTGDDIIVKVNPGEWVFYEKEINSPSIFSFLYFLDTDLNIYDIRMDTIARDEVKEEYLEDAGMTELVMEHNGWEVYIRRSSNEAKSPCEIMLYQELAETTRYMVECDIPIPSRDEEPIDINEFCTRFAELITMEFDS